MKNLNLTELETKVLQALIDSLYAEAGFSDVDANDLTEITDIDKKQIRGVLASLVKKGIVHIEETSTFRAPKYQIIYLDTQYWYLHPEWKEDYDVEKYGDAK